MPYVLPFELILLIISTICKEEDEESLKRFSLTSSAFRAPCQRILFSHICITSSLHPSEWLKSPGKRLLDLFSSSPVISSYITKITISDWDEPWAIWLPSDASLGEALDKIDLSNVEEFVLVCDATMKGWGDILQSTRRAIVKICQSPGLLGLTLCNTPIELVNACGPSLKYLKVYDCSVGLVDKDTDLVSPRQSSEIALDHLQLYHMRYDSSDQFFLRSPQVRIDRLRVLHIDVAAALAGQWYERVQALIQICCGTLDTLVMEVCTDTILGANTVSDTFSIANCPNLKTLHLKLDANALTFGGGLTDLPWAASFIRNIPPSNNLEGIHLDLRVQPAFGRHVPLGVETILETLRPASDAVAEATSFRRLKAFGVNIQLYKPSKKDIEIDYAYALRGLSALHKRGLLHLTVSSCDAADRGCPSTTTMPYYTLPFELILLIIATICKETEEEYLKNFSLTSSAFRIPCQKILFSHIRLALGADDPLGWSLSPGERLLDLFSSSPAASSYVKKLTITDWCEPWMNWLRYDSSLGEALDRINLSNLEEVVLELTREWHEIPDFNRRAIVRLCQSPVLLRLTLGNAPVELVQVCGPSLKYLKVHDCDVGLVERDPDLAPVRQSSEVSLDHLKLFDAEHYTLNLFFLKSSLVNQLRVLDLNITAALDDNWYEKVDVLIQGCCRTLETLIMDVCFDILRTEDTVSDVFSIANCENLTMLHLKVEANTSNTEGEVTGLPWTVCFVSSITPSNSLQEIRLDVEIKPAGGWHREIDADTLLETLGPMSDVVAEPTFFPQLKAFKVNIRLPKGGYEEDLEDISAQDFSAAHKRGLLHLTVSPHDSVS
ncbi:hypothetical protein NMY22_g208 [Coprinellus aureogranulatus]|nr:hypothetical protein NMY22_g208 [Coprinellus aureogranulatus]